MNRWLQVTTVVTVLLVMGFVCLPTARATPNQVEGCVTGTVYGTWCPTCPLFPLSHTQVALFGIEFNLFPPSGGANYVTTTWTSDRGAFKFDGPPVVEGQLAALWVVAPSYCRAHLPIVRETCFQDQVLLLCEEEPLLPTNTPSASPSSTSTPSVTSSLTPSATLTPSLTSTPTWTASPSASTTPSVAVTLTPTSTASVTSSLTPSATVTPSLTSTPTWTASPSATTTPSVTVTLTPTSTASVTSSVTPSATPTPSLTSTPTWTASPSTTTTPSNTSAPTHSPSLTPSPTGTPELKFGYVFHRYNGGGVCGVQVVFVRLADGVEVMRDVSQADGSFLYWGHDLDVEVFLEVVGWRGRLFYNPWNMAWNQLLTFEIYEDPEVPAYLRQPASQYCLPTTNTPPPNRYASYLPISYRH